jgi:hypothetical protein
MQIKASYIVGNEKLGACNKMLEQIVKGIWGNVE